MNIWRNLKFIISLNYYISLIYYISPDMFSFGRSGRFCQKFFIVKNSNISEQKLKKLVFFSLQIKKCIKLFIVR